MTETKQELSGTGIDNLCREPESLAKIPNDAILSVGFGVAESTPLRVISYPILALEILKQKPETTLEMYIATEFNQLLYGIDPETTATNVQRLQKAVINFSQLFYPEIADRISFIPTNPLTETRINLLNEFVDILKTNAELVRFAFAPGKNGLDSLAYLAAHALYMRDVLEIDQSLFLVDLPQNGNPIVMIGGDAERISLLSRQEIFKQFGVANINPPLQIFTSLGRTPPYFRKDNEPIIGEKINTSFLLVTSPETYRDYAATLAAITRARGHIPFTFDDIGAKQRERKSLLNQSSTIQALVLLNEFSQECIV